MLRRNLRLAPTRGNRFGSSSTARIRAACGVSDAHINAVADDRKINRIGQ